MALLISNGLMTGNQFIGVDDIPATELLGVALSPCVSFQSSSDFIDWLLQ